MSSIVEKAKKEFLKMIEDFGEDPYNLRSHVFEVEKWAKYLLKRYPEADSEVVLLSVWMHDFGHYPTQDIEDHAVLGEERARKFLEGHDYPKDKMQKVLHCVRSHRCRDVMPNTLEAKITACVDSASHMTDFIYLDMAKEDKENSCELRAYAKMERDFRDLGLFPEIQDELEDLYMSWKKLLEAFERVDLE